MMVIVAKRIPIPNQHTHKAPHTSPLSHLSVSFMILSKQLQRLSLTWILSCLAKDHAPFLPIPTSLLHSPQTRTWVN